MRRAAFAADAKAVHGDEKRYDHPEAERNHHNEGQSEPPRLVQQASHEGANHECHTRDGALQAHHEPRALGERRHKGGSSGDHNPRGAHALDGARDGEEAGGVAEPEPDGASDHSEETKVHGGRAPDARAELAAERGAEGQGPREERERDAKEGRGLAELRRSERSGVGGGASGAEWEVGRAERRAG